MHRHSLIPSPAGVRRRTLLAVVALVLAAQGATVFVVHRMTAAGAVASPPPSWPAAEPPRHTAFAARRFPGAAALPADDEAPVAASSGSARLPASRLVHMEPPRAPWSQRPLDDAGAALAGQVGRSADELRLLADGQGRLTEAARTDLLAGRDAARQIAEGLGIPEDSEDVLVQSMVGFMVRRVTMRETFRGTNVTPEAIDEAARADALASAQALLGDQAREAVAAALPKLPDLTADLPPATP